MSNEWYNLFFLFRDSIEIEPASKPNAVAVSTSDPDNC